MLNSPRKLSLIHSIVAALAASWGSAALARTRHQGDGHSSLTSRNGKAPGGNHIAQRMATKKKNQRRHCMACR
jgi:hypothetical protein